MASWVGKGHKRMKAAVTSDKLLGIKGKFAEKDE